MYGGWLVGIERTADAGHEGGLHGSEREGKLSIYLVNKWELTVLLIGPVPEERGYAGGSVLVVLLPCSLYHS